MTRVLIVDDQKENLYLLKVLLEAQQFEVVSAQNGVEALERAREIPPDIIISDILMPVMDGFSLCREWRKDDRLKHIPLVFYTASYTDSRDEELGLSLGAVRYIIKPVDTSVLVDTVKEVIRENEAQRLVIPEVAVADEKTYYRLYNDALIRKLEEKMMRLEEANLALEKDIAERKRAEAALKESEELFQSLVETMPDGVVILDWNGTILFANRRAVSMVGYEKSEEIFGRKLEDFVHPDSLGRAMTDIAEIKKGGGGYLVEFIIIREGRREKAVEGVGTTIYFKGNTTALVTIRDITERKLLESQLVQAQKMEVVGTLAGGLAHDFNNVLGGIVGVVSILKFKLGGNKELSRQAILEYVTTIEQSGDRATDMVKQLLTLSRKQEISFAPVDLNLTVKHVMKICQNTFNKSIELKPTMAEGQAIISADPVQVEQILLNLCVNASHSMTIMRPQGEKQGGTISVTLKLLKADRNFCFSRPDAVAGINYWQLSVGDNGIGMDTSTIAKIFDPFFTTKGKGQGTGLGLAMVYSIIKQHKGFVEVYSEVGRGSQFNVYFQAAEKAEICNVGPKDFRLVRGEGVVLVVDDEPVMRRLAEGILTECGYTVLMAESGDEAIRIFKEQKEKIKLVLLDMSMPKKTGRETYIEMEQIDSGAKVILASGFRKDEHVEAILALGVKDFIQKPYTIETLPQTVARVISEC